MLPQTELNRQLLLPINESYNPLNFVKFIEDTSLNNEEKIRNDIKEYLEEMDFKFRYNPNRKERYYVAYKGERTIITMHGEVTYSRTLYKDRIDGSYYCYVDEKMGIGKYYHYTNDVACYIAEAYADENSMIKVGIEVGNLIHAKFSLKDNRTYTIPRQTIYNLMKRTKEIRLNPKCDKESVDDIYVLIDEKYLPCHKDESNHMLKSALIVEGLNKTSNKRHSYIKPQYLTLYDTKNFAIEILNYLDSYYHLDKIKHIHVLADGALWIKNVAKELKCPNSKLTQYLCKFHYTQNLWRLFKDKPLYLKALDYLFHNDKKSLYKLFEAIKTDTNKDYIKYIKNNYSLIQNSIHLKSMNCAMERCISHHLHSEFDNVPKVYSKTNLNRYLSYRDNYKNKENLKELFILSLLDKDKGSTKTIINKQILNFSHFDNQTQLPYYSITLANGKKPVSFNDYSSLAFI